MYKKIIKNYINNLTKSDIINFAKKENFILTDDEVEYLFKTIKKDWEIFLNEDPSPIFKNLKQNVRPEIYDYILEQYQKYYEFL